MLALALLTLERVSPGSCSRAPAPAIDLAIYCQLYPDAARVFPPEAFNFNYTELPSIEVAIGKYFFNYSFYAKKLFLIKKLLLFGKQKVC